MCSFQYASFSAKYKTFNTPFWVDFLRILKATSPIHFVLYGKFPPHAAFLKSVSEQPRQCCCQNRHIWTCLESFWLLSLGCQNVIYRVVPRCCCSYHNAQDIPSITVVSPKCEKRQNPVSTFLKGIIFVKKKINIFVYKYYSKLFGI